MFNDRRDAGLKLAQALDKYKDQDAVVLGIPRGGVEIAYYVALRLKASLSMVIVRKLGHPDEPEAALGAIGEDGSLYIPKGTSRMITPAKLNSIIELEREEIQRRIKTLRKGKPLPELKGRTVIIADDGVATGATLFTAIATCRNADPASLVVAVPIAVQEMEHKLQKLADDVIILEKPAYLDAVGQGYRHFGNLTDEETIAFMNAWENRLQNA